MTHNQSSSEQGKLASIPALPGPGSPAKQVASDSAPYGHGYEQSPFDDAESATGATLLTVDEQNSMRSRWRSIQEKFVDDPQLAVESADELVGETIQRLSELFRVTRQSLEEGWGKDGDPSSTEELRQALRRYRTFFDRILAV